MTSLQEWLALNEAARISDALKGADRETVQFYKRPLRDFFAHSLNGQRQIDALAGYFAFLYIQEKVQQDALLTQITQDWGRYRDYLVHLVDSTDRTLLNQTSFNRQALELAGQQWHRDLQIGGRNFRRGPNGLKVVQVEEILKHVNIEDKPEYKSAIWAGWSWTSLGCGSSDLEGAAGGHCGNSGASRGDNILSLRDPKNKVHLTFIVNIRTGKLGEAKGVNNNKPSDHYHPAIVSLLLSGFIKGFSDKNIYLPENNFKAEDLPKDAQELVSSHIDGVEDHQVPENYKKVEWLYQHKQEDIDKLSPNQKLALLDEVLKVMGNHKPLDHEEYDDEGSLTPIKGWTKPESLDFSLNQMAQDALPAIRSLKQLLAFWDRLYNARWANRGPNRDAFPVWFPDRTEEEWNDGKLSDLPFDASYDIEESTLEEWINRAIEMAGDGSIRDKSTLSSKLEEYGFEQQDEKPYDDLPNRYQKHIDGLIASVLDEVVKNKRMGNAETDVVHNAMQNSFRGPHMTMDERKAQTIEERAKIWPRGLNYFDFVANKTKIRWNFYLWQIDGLMRVTEDPGSYSEGARERSHQFESALDKALNKMLPLLKERGYSSFLSRGQWRHQGESQTIETCVKGIFTKKVTQETGLLIKRRNVGTVKYKPEDNMNSELYWFTDAMESIKELKQDGKITAPFKMADELFEAAILMFNRHLKNLETLIAENIDHIVRCTNKPTTKWVNTDNGSKNVEYPRDIQRSQHHSPRNETTEIIKTGKSAHAEPKIIGESKSKRFAKVSDMLVDMGMNDLASRIDVINQEQWP